MKVYTCYKIKWQFKIIDSQRLSHYFVQRMLLIVSEYFEYDRLGLDVLQERFSHGNSNLKYVKY